MADAPKLFGKPGERQVDGATSTRKWLRWEWRCGEWLVRLKFDGVGQYTADTWLDSEKVWYCAGPSHAEVMRLTEERIAEYAADLDAMGVPRG